jgi:hypothetical protein
MSYKRAKHTFNPERTDLIKVVAVYVRIYTEQSAHDGAHCLFECSGKWHAYALLRREAYTKSKWQDVPMVFGKTASSSRIFWAQFMRASTYSGAGSFVGRL